MENIIVILAISSLVITSSGLYFIRSTSRSPANGEVKRLQNLEDKLNSNVAHFKIVETQKSHYVKLS